METHSLLLSPDWCCKADVVPQKFLLIEVMNNHPSVLYLSSTPVGKQVIDFIVFTKKFLFLHPISLPFFFPWLNLFYVLCSASRLHLLVQFHKNSRRAEVGWWSVRVCVINMLLKFWKRWKTRRDPKVQPRSLFHAIDK